MKNSMRRMVAALALIAVFCMAVPALAETDMAVSDCIVRSGPSDDYPMIGVLSSGEHVKVNFAQGAWSDITFANGTGYVRSASLVPVIDSGVVPVIGDTGPGVVTSPYVDPVPVIPNPVPVIPADPIPVIPADPVPVIPQIVQPTGSSTSLVTNAKVNVRSGPGTNYSKIGVLSKGAPVCVIATAGAWDKINFNGLIGYVYAKYVSQGTTTVSGYLTPMDAYMTTNSITTFYNGTGRQYGEAGAVNAGYTVHVVGMLGNWYKVEFGNDYAYVQRAFLSYGF